MYRCVYCGNEYQEKKEQCSTCGGRKFEQLSEGLIVLDPGVSFIPRPMPLRTITKGQKPPPKPLLPLRRLQPDDSLIYNSPYDDGNSWPWLVLLCALMLGIPIVMLAMWASGGG